MDPQRRLHVVHLLIRNRIDGSVGFLVYPHPKWKDSEGRPYWALPAKKTVEESLTPFLHGNSLEHFIEGIMEKDLGLQKDDDAYALEQELPPAQVELPSPNTGRPTHYTVYPVDVWVDLGRREAVRAGVKGEWVAWDVDPKKHPLSPTAAAVFRLIGERERRLDALYAKDPEAERKPAAERRLLLGVGKRPTMEAQARRWLSHNRGGVRCLRKQELDDILAAGDRAFNLRVADPYLRYQLQGVGFTWSFFTEKDPQDLHVHGAPIVEIYGVLEGELEVWWKAYYDRGTSAWCRRVLKAGDWLEVDSLQCHIVHWNGKGKGVVFKAGPGPLAEVGRLGVKGKTRCGIPNEDGSAKEEACPCMKPEEVVRLIQSSGK